jgi:4-hydroxy-2-oxoheptanedioate aldolase
MEILENTFKIGLGNCGVQYGVWCVLSNSYSTELIASVGFDWILLDAEHAPNDLRSVFAQLQAIQSYKTSTIVRLPDHSATEIKKYLDIGVQNLLIPMVETADQARGLVSAMRYPPKGGRGIGAGLARASRWGGIKNYLQKSESQLCLIIQIETKKGLENLEEILDVEGVDAIFFGPSDLAASVGSIGNPSADKVKTMIYEGIACAKKRHIPSGILAFNMNDIMDYIGEGVGFIAIGADSFILRQGAEALLENVKSAR